MRVWTKAVSAWDEQLQQYVMCEAESESFDYEGPVALAGGGPSREQRDASKAQANLDNQSALNSAAGEKLVQDQYAKINPFATSRMNNGLPFYNALTDYASGTNAQAYAPARAALLRQMGNYGSLPSGFKTQALSDFDAQRAQGYDSALTQNLGANEQAKNNAAGMLVGQQQIANPIGWAQTAGSGNNSIMQAPLASPGLGSLFGGLAQGAMGSIPF